MQLDKQKYHEIDRIIDRAIGSMRIVYPYCLDRNDLKQFAWIKILTYLCRFSRLKGKFSGFIFTIAKQAITSKLYQYGAYQYRENKKIIKGEKPGSINFYRIDEIEPYYHHDYLEKIIAEAEKNQLLERINIAKKRISNVSESHLKCFEMHYEKGYDYYAISDMLDMDYNKVRSMGYYSARLFRKEFENLNNLEKVKEQKFFTITRGNEGNISFYPNALIKDNKIVCRHIIKSGICCNHINVRLFKLKHEVVPGKWEWLCTKHLNKYLNCGWEIERKVTQKEYLEMAKRELNSQDIPPAPPSKGGIMVGEAK